MNAVIYGAGSIGRGFIAELMHKSGFDITLIDVNTELLDLLNEKKEYTLQLISKKGIEEVLLPVGRAINGNDAAAVKDAISNCDIIFTAVGANALKYIAENLAHGLSARTESVNIILCENMQNAHIEMDRLLKENMDNTDNVGLLRASVGRMVPLPVAGEDPLIVKAEPYYHLPVDGDFVVGDILEFLGLELTSPFDFAIDRKLYIHNLGHAASAYLGYLHGCEYIYQCMQIDSIKDTVRQVMKEAAAGLFAKYNCDKQQLNNHIEDLLNRFGNQHLGDTVARVGKDLRRKLSSTDRLIGALNLCIQYALPHDTIGQIIKSALKFQNDDEGTNYVQNLIAQ